MDVAVGSGNPVKLGAVRDAFDRLGGATVEAVAVDSGVSEQPRDRAETVRGAENRAERALAAGTYDFGVGLEGGVAEPDAAEGLYLIMWAAATDGGSLGRGAGPSLRLPAEIADRVRAGEELGPVMDDVVGAENLKEKEGAAGLLTAGVIDRRAALTSAVAGALGPFVSEHY